MPTSFPISNSLFYKEKKIVGTRMYYCNMFNKCKVIENNSKFPTLKTHVQYPFWKIQKKKIGSKKPRQSSKATQTTDARS